MTIRNKPQKPRPNRGWLLLLALEALAIPAMGLVLVWSGIERTDTTYFINIAQNEARERQTLHAKLEMERDRLLSPYELRRRAEEFGMKEPKAGQIRCMGVR
ncbi:MAG: hypothetical protein HDQ91_03070 [Desulfovibrio sp.]|nr:hypothetical protein [Desulfovibrio sp.]